ncbi:hypothetical protein NB640_11820 [Oxalobacter vibrioformis]|uniref:Uncharacterized protein n=1 Tax=Oxalobacter vibrioformis TaxID=933080 RepID=A0A9E9LUJ4_9BURK|nr:hypothetical protein [Oxalobacter vibrioformis]WAW09890.1 hypothetical protein NB640_11820 [Oxalobacter vibrioformis]
MPAITFDKFELGIDHRKAASVSDANRLREMKNAYVTTGLATSKRPGLKKMATLEAGTKGLVAALGKLHTFYGSAFGEITHTDARFQANRLTCRDETLDTITDIHFADVFNGYLYVVAGYGETTLHHYLQPEPEDEAEPEEEAESEDKESESTAEGSDGAGEEESEGEEETEEQAPDLPFVTQITDENCPHTTAVLKLASKIFAVSPDGSTVRYSRTGAPTDWTEADDAGFLPTGLNARGDRATNALGIYANRLVALTRDGAQVWIADPDPSVMRLDEIVENVGTSYPQSLATVSGDLYFLSDFGFRSITTRQLMTKLADLDIGSPIDTLVRPVLKEATSLPKAAYFYGTGQYLCAIGRQIFVYSVSKSSGIAAWSRYELPFDVDALAELDGVLYLRSGDDVYQLSEEQHTDDGEEYEVVLQMAYLDFKSDGMLKRVYAIDLVMEGECYFSLGFDVRNTEAFTEEIRVIGNTRPGGLIPLDATGTEFSPRFRNKDGKPFQLNALTIYYEIQGPL